MESKTDSETVATKKAKVTVTLTNWQRLNNAPILLSNVSAVPWNDYLFVLASNGTTLLYHIKLKLWSMLPKYNDLYTDGKNVSLVNYKGKILTIYQSNKIVAFDPSLIDWRAINKQPGCTTYIAVRGDTLYVITNKNTLLSLDNEEWKE